MSSLSDNDSKKSVSSNDSYISQSELAALGISFDYIMNEMAIGDATMFRSRREGENEAITDFNQLDFSSLFTKYKAKTRDIHTNVPSYRPITAGKREYREFKYNSHNMKSGHLFSEGTTVFLTDGTNKVAVGISHHRCNSRVPVRFDDCVKVADRFAEEVAGKGTGLGFSVFLHSIATISIARCGGTLEDLEGNDLSFPPDLHSIATVSGELHGLTIEITGLNFADRKTSCSWCIDKYSLLPDNEETIRIKQLSNKEETHDTSMFIGTGLDIKDSPYTSTLDRIHKAMRLLTNKQIKAIEQNVARWFLMLEESKTPDLKDDDWPEEFKQLGIVGSKDGKYPTPFRALPRHAADQTTTEIRYADVDVDYRWHEGSGNSTYHVLNGDVDYLKLVCTVALAQEKPYSAGQYGAIETLLFTDHLSRYNAIQAVCLEADAFRRIDGVAGSFFCRGPQVGICWSAKNRNSQVYNVRFYTFTDPGNELLVGKWSKTKNKWYSPTFKLSKGEIDHATSLPGKLQAAWTSVCNTATRSEMRGLETSFCKLANVWRNSSWQTSVYNSTSRFKTTGHLAGTGNFNQMNRKAWTSMHLMRSSDYTLYRLDLQATNSLPPSSVTPLLQLPLRYHCLEKDMPHGMYWHIRPSKHDIDCNKKMLESVSQEMEERVSDLVWLNIQAKALEDILEFGMKENRFMQVMMTKPKHATLNIIMYIGLASACKESLETASSTQTNTGFSMNNMLSDRGSLWVSRNVATSGKVASNMTRLVKELKPDGPYSLLLKSIDRGADEHYYSISAKDAKSGDREIMTMDAILRPSQMFKESQSKTVSLASPDDALMESEKYCPMVEGFREIFSHDNAIVSSEDRSFFCGRLHPEKMSLCSLAVAIVIGSGGMTSVSSLQRLDKSRCMILTPEMTTDDFPVGVKPEKTMLRRMQKSERPAFVVRLLRHMGQGIQAINAGVINTVFNRGLMNMCRNAVGDDVISDYIITTSDDVGRGVAHIPTVTTSSVKELFIERPLDALGHCMMEDNKKKRVVIDEKGLVEVNNITVVTSGMLPQCHIFATLAVQPLNGPGPMHDLISCISQSRSVLWWTAPPNVVWSAYLASVDMLYDRWRMNADDRITIEMSGLLPDNVNELISGFWPRKPNAISALWSSTSEELQESVLCGDRPLHLSLTNKTSFGAEDPEVEEIEKTGFNIFDRKTKAISMGRKMGGRIKSIHLRRPKVSRLVSKKNVLIEHLRKPVAEYPDLSHLAPPKITSWLKPATRADKLPQKMGKASSRLLPDTRRIASKRLFNIKYREDCTEEELAITEMDEDSYNKSMSDISRKKSWAGFEFNSPAGLPTVGFLDGIRYTTPMSFNFAPNVDDIVVKKHVLSINGCDVDDLKPSFWSDKSLLRLYKSTPISFACGSIDGQRYAFFKMQNSQIVKKKINNSHGSLMGSRGVMWSYLDGLTTGPITEGDLSLAPRSLPLATGMPIAMVNLSNWYRCTSHDAFKFWQSVFVGRGCNCPWFMRNSMLVWPYSDGNQVFDGNNNYMLSGRYTTSMLLKQGSGPPVEIDASSRVAKTVELIVDTDPDDDYGFKVHRV